MSIEAMKQALEALENLQGLCSEESGFVEQVTIWTPEAIYALRTAIAEAEKQEPVKDRLDFWALFDENQRLRAELKFNTTPPAAQRQWVELTEADIRSIDTSEFWDDRTPMDFARVIESKLKELNT